MKHHPSCKENDRDLVWHCSQCGLNESAADLESEILELRKVVAQDTNEIIELHKTSRDEKEALRNDHEKEMWALHDKMAELQREVNTYRSFSEVTDLHKSLRYAFENLPYPDTLTGNGEYDKARIALGIELNKCNPIK